MDIPAFLLVQFFLHGYFLQGLSADDILVTIDKGILNGTTDATKAGTPYYGFLGIPYAKPPVGDLRFLAPQDPEQWDGIRDASEFGQECVQDNGGFEDCLYLNVYTPKLPETDDEDLLPVTVWIHGGAFVSGNGNIRPGHLIDENVVVVAMNYRLNVFGFLAVNGTQATGNAGLKDQNAALRWVQKNIARFGGDPKKVMILGGSAGGASVSYHVLSPMSAGLFIAADAESGSALNPWAFHYDTQHFAFRLGTIFGNDTTDPNKLVEFLRTVDADDLEYAVSKKVLTAEEKTRFLSYPFEPTVDFPSDTQEPFLTDTPRAMLAAGNFNKVVFLTGVTIQEGRNFIGDTSPDKYWDAINNDIERIVPEDLFLAKGSQESLEVADKIKTFYFGDETPSQDTRTQWIDLQTDILFALGVETSVHQMSKFNPHVYNYQFVYKNAGHDAERSYLLNDGDLSNTDSTSVKVALSMFAYWTNVIKEGLMLPSTANGRVGVVTILQREEYRKGIANPGTYEDVTWTPVTESEYPFLKINETCTLEENLENDRINFWFNIYKKYSNSTNA